MKIHRNVLPNHDLLANPKWVACDTEWFEMKKSRLHRPVMVDGSPNGEFACLQIATDEENVHLIDDPLLVPIALDRIRNCVQIWFNAAFDVTQLKRIEPEFKPKKLWDAFLIEKINHAGYYNKFGEKDLVRRYLDEYMDKKIRDKFIKGGELTDEMVEYACLDAIKLYQLTKLQKPEVTKNSLKIYKKIDLPALWAILDMPGWTVNSEKWIELAKTHEKVVEEVRDSFEFNINSTKQKVEFLHSIGLKVPNAQRKTFEKFLEQDKTGSIQKMLDYSDHVKGQSTYGKPFIDEHVEPDGKFYSQINVAEAVTGRMSAKTPNQQNIFTTEEYRSLIISNIGADYQAQEPRITAYLTKDKVLLQAIMAGEDVHTNAARVVFNDKSIQKDDPRRGAVKGLNLGMTYGMSKWGLKASLGCSMEEAEELLSRYFKIFVGVYSWINFQRAEAKRNGYVETVLGRRHYLNMYSYKWKNNALNSPIQGTAADITKLAVSRLHKSCAKKGLTYSLVGIIHDELQNYVENEEEKKEYAKTLKICMESAGEDICTGIPFVAVVKSGGNWWECH